MKKFRIKERRFELNDGTTEIQYEIQERRFLRWKTLNLWYQNLIDSHETSRLCVFQDKNLVEKLLRDINKIYQCPFDEIITPFVVWDTRSTSSFDWEYKIMYFCNSRENFYRNGLYLGVLYSWEELMERVAKYPKRKSFISKLFKN